MLKASPIFPVQTVRIVIAKRIIILQVVAQFVKNIFPFQELSFLLWFRPGTRLLQDTVWFRLGTHFLQDFVTFSNLVFFKQFPILSLCKASMIEVNISPCSLVNPLHSKTHLAVFFYFDQSHPLFVSYFKFDLLVTFLP
jgi:hypothetical protein